MGHAPERIGSDRAGHSPSATYSERPRGRHCGRADRGSQHNSTSRRTGHNHRRLRSVPTREARPGRTFLLARANGFRVEGWQVGADATDELKLVLSRQGEAPRRFKATLPEPIPLAESQILARRLSGPLLKDAVAKGDDAAKSWSLAVLRWLDPVGLLEQVQKTRFKSRNPPDNLKRRAALAVAAADPDEAAAIAETILDPSNRADALIALVDVVPTADRTRKLALLDAAVFEAKASDLSSNKLYVMGEVAERWLELGEHKKARALFAEGRTLVEVLPPIKRTDAGSFLARLARVEPAAALALLKDVGTSAGATGPSPTRRFAWRLSIRRKRSSC